MVAESLSSPTLLQPRSAFLAAALGLPLQSHWLSWHITPRHSTEHMQACGIGPCLTGSGDEVVEHNQG